VTAIAQTNLQLFNQLMAAGWSDVQLERTQAAYAFATDLFAGKMRSSGKTLVEHVVGTASAVAVTGGRPPLVHAALLHAAYTFGEFGGRHHSSVPSKRAAVRAVIGDEAEELVAGYASLGYSAATIRDWRQRGSDLTAREHDLAVLRIANEVDEHTDFGTRYSDRGGHPMSSDAIFETMISLAHEIEEPVLAALMDQIRLGEIDVTVPPVLRSMANEMEVIAPRTYWPRPAYAFRQAKVRVRRQIAAIPGARRLRSVVR
jgi:HD domain